MKRSASMLAIALLMATAPAYAAAKKLKVTMTFITAEGVGKPAGTVVVAESKNGVTLMTDLKGLPPGEHGFHLHEKASCDPAEKDGKMAAGGSAGAHFDPDNTKAHKGPGGGGHKGDLPKLQVSDKGVAKEKLDVPGLKLDDVAGRTLIIHAGGDNYSDTPKPHGGGGDRALCGVVPAAK
jgi:Cu-Zn family superoxide dismutase